MSDEASNSIELVITAPKPYGTQLAYHTGSRTTLGVLVELFATAQRQVVIAAPFFQSGHGLSGGILAQALLSALQRGANVDIVSTEHGLQTIDMDRLQESAQGRIRLFQPSANLEDEGRLGSHAKFCISDSERAYIGSANLTGPGLSGHLEMGLLVHGGVARQIADFWNYCVEVGLFVCLDEGR